MSKFQEIQEKLEQQRDTLERRLGKIGADRSRTQGPLDADSQEQAIELENAPVLDALDASGHVEFEEVQAALARLAAGSFGICSECGEDITIGRLEAVPAARCCVGCAS